MCWVQDVVLSAKYADWSIILTSTQQSQWAVHCAVTVFAALPVPRHAESCAVCPDFVLAALPVPRHAESCAVCPDFVLAALPVPRHAESSPAGVSERDSVLWWDRSGLHTHADWCPWLPGLPQAGRHQPGVHVPTQVGPGFSVSLFLL